MTNCSILLNDLGTRRNGRSRLRVYRAAGIDTRSVVACAASSNGAVLPIGAEVKD
jgi:hypothetical protein